MLSGSCLLYGIDPNVLNCLSHIKQDNILKHACYLDQMFELK